jgi:hypothetical protein
MRKKFMAIRVTQSKKPSAEGYANLLPAADFPARMPNCHTVSFAAFEKRKPEYRIGHLRLASNRIVALRSGRNAAMCANSSNIGQAIASARS